MKPKRSKWPALSRSGRAAALLAGLFSLGCSPFRISLEWGHAPLAYPRQSTVDSLVCTPTKDPQAAVLNAWSYLRRGAFAWMDDSHSIVYLQRAIDRRTSGDCPCPEEGCAALPPVEPLGGAL